MTRNKLLSDISISSLQAILNQLAGIVVFFIISKYLDKNSFGQINWLLAVLMVIFTVLGCGLDQLVVKKTATGTDPGLLLAMYFFHVLITGASFLGIVFIVQQASPVFQKDNQLFFLLSVSQCLAFFSIPFKQIVNGLEKFKALFVMSSCANLCKIISLLLLAFSHQITLLSIVWVYLFASFAELLVCIYMYKVYLQLPIYLGHTKKQYTALFKESLPQLGIAVFNTAVARFDWILVGILSTTLVVAEYSFAYRLFELASLPLLILAPVLFPRISKLFADDTGDNQTKKQLFLPLVIRVEIMIAVFVAIVVNICWKETIDFLTGSKYGSSTAQVIFVLSFCMPLLYLNNILWSINFAKARMRVIFFCILVTFLVNIAADLLLIPAFSATGAALGFVISTLVQTIFYSKKTKLGDAKIFWLQLLLVAGIGLAAGFLSKYLFVNPVKQLIAACIAYVSLLLFTGQLTIKDWLLFKRITAA